MAFGKSRKGAGAGAHSAADYSRNSSNYGSGGSAYKPADASSYSRSNYGSGAHAAAGAGTSTNPYSRNSGQYSSRRNRKMSVGGKVAVAICAVLVAIVAGCGTAAGLYLNSVNSNLQSGYDEEQQMAIKDSLVQTSNYNEPFYVLLIGTDRRKNNPSMGARSDTNVLCRVDATKGQVTMMSIPRDTKITYKGSTMKFNAAYTVANGASGAIEAATELTGVKIAHYAEVSFTDLRNLVDAIGGIEVDVPYKIEDEKAGSSVIEKGKQTLNGRQALTFARSRQYADGDFTRTSNQRIVIEAMVKKVMSLPATELLGVVQNASQCVTTDMSVMDIYSLATQFMNVGLKKLKIYSCMAPSTTGMENGVSWVFSDTQGLQNMIELMDAGKDPNKATTSGATGSALATSSDDSDDDSSSSSSSSSSSKSSS